MWLVHQIIEDLPQGLLFALLPVERQQLIEVDAAVGDGSGFVQIQAVNPRELLDLLQLLNQCVVPGETNGRDGEVERGEQHEAFRDHSHHAGNRGDDRLAPQAG